MTVPTEADQTGKRKLQITFGSDFLKSGEDDTGKLEIIVFIAGAIYRMIGSDIGYDNLAGTMKDFVIPSAIDVGDSFAVNVTTKYDGGRVHEEHDDKLDLKGGPNVEDLGVPIGIPGGTSITLTQNMMDGTLDPNRPKVKSVILVLQIVGKPETIMKTYDLAEMAALRSSGENVVDINFPDGTATESDTFNLYTFITNDIGEETRIYENISMSDAPGVATIKAVFSGRNAAGDNLMRIYYDANDKTAYNKTYIEKTIITLYDSSGTTELGRFTETTPVNTAVADQVFTSFDANIPYTSFKLNGASIIDPSALTTFTVELTREDTGGNTSVPVRSSHVVKYLDLDQPAVKDMSTSFTVTTSSLDLTVNHHTVQLNFDNAIQLLDHARGNGMDVIEMHIEFPATVGGIPGALRTEVSGGLNATEFTVDDDRTDDNSVRVGKLHLPFSTIIEPSMNSNGNPYMILNVIFDAGSNTYKIQNNRITYLSKSVLETYHSKTVSTFSAEAAAAVGTLMDLATFSGNNFSFEFRVNAELLPASESIIKTNTSFKIDTMPTIISYGSNDRFFSLQEETEATDYMYGPVRGDVVVTASNFDNAGKFINNIDAGTRQILLSLTHSSPDNLSVKVSLHKYDDDAQDWDAPIVIPAVQGGDGEFYTFDDKAAGGPYKKIIPIPGLTHMSRYAISYEAVKTTDTNVKKARTVVEDLSKGFGKITPYSGRDPLGRPNLNIGNFQVLKTVRSTSSFNDIQYGAQDLNRLFPIYARIGEIPEASEFYVKNSGLFRLYAEIILYDVNSGGATDTFTELARQIIYIDEQDIPAAAAAGASRVDALDGVYSVTFSGVDKTDGVRLSCDFLVEQTNLTDNFFDPASSTKRVNGVPFFESGVITVVEPPEAADAITISPDGGDEDATMPHYILTIPNVKANGARITSLLFILFGQDTNASFVNNSQLEYYSVTDVQNIAPADIVAGSTMLTDNNYDGSFSFKIRPSVFRGNGFYLDGAVGFLSNASYSAFIGPVLNTLT